MLNDLRFAFRMLLKHRWFSAAVIVTIALGIGINTTVFTLVNAVLFKPVPIPRGERLVVVSNQNSANQGNNRVGVSWAEYQQYRQNNDSFESLQATSNGEAVISDPGNPPQRYGLSRISPGLFGMLQTPPILGRTFSLADADPGAETAVLLGHEVWQQRYAGASDVIGRTIRLNEAPATIVGVMPEGFKFPANQDLWIPLVPTAQLENRANRSLQLFGILNSDTPIERAQQDLSVISDRLAAEFPDTNENIDAWVMTFHQAFNGGEIRIVFLMMLGAVGFVLLIACANVANMMLSRAITRHREISIRAAMGASRRKIIRQLLVESVLLSVIGGLLGLAFSGLGVHAFDLATENVGKPYWIIFDMDWRAFGYFAVISILSGVIFGLMPALRASRVDLNTALKDGTPGGGSARGGWLTGSLVVLQFALTVVLLAGAGMMVRSFFAAQAINDFVPAENLFTARLFPPEGEGERYFEPDTRKQLYTQLLERTRALPGVTAAAAASHLPGLGSAPRPIEFDGRPIEEPGSGPRASMVVQTPGFFDTIGLPILQGRDFDLTDGRPGQEAVVVTREFAQLFWPDEDALGKRFRLIDGDEPDAWMTVVGLCADIEQNPTDTDAPPTFFVTHEQQAWSWMGIMVRTRNDPAALTATMRSLVQDIDQDLPLFNVSTLTGALDQSQWFLRVFGTLFLVFALIGLLMASVGIYAVVAQATARRTREIGIRMALGATAGRIIKLVLGRGMRQLLIGLVIGLAGAVGATSLMDQVGFLIGISPHDPFVFAAITGLLVAIGVFACWLPARRAAHLHPVKALRDE